VETGKTGIIRTGVFLCYVTETFKSPLRSREPSQPYYAALLEAVISAGGGSVGNNAWAGLLPYLIRYENWRPKAVLADSELSGVADG